MLEIRTKTLEPEGGDCISNMEMATGDANGGVHHPPPLTRYINEGICPSFS